MGTNTGPRMAHLAEAEGMNKLVRATMTMKMRMRGMPVRPMFWMKSAPPMAMTVPMLVQLNRALNWPQKKQKVR